MDYMVYVSHDAENLQFWLWLQDYTKRFYAAPKNEQNLSPPWVAAEQVQPYGNASDQPPRTADKSRVDISEYEAKFDHPETFSSPINTTQFDKQSFISGIASSNRTVADSVDDANAQMGLKWQSCEFASVPVERCAKSFYSHNPTFPDRNQPSHQPLSRSELPARIKSIPPNTCRCPPRPPTYDPPFRPGRGQEYGRGQLTRPIPSKLYSLVDL